MIRPSTIRRRSALQSRRNSFRACCALAGFALLALALRASAADDWPQFRGPDAQGHSDSVGLPTHWTETQNIAWKANIPGVGWSSPVIKDGKVWLTTAIDDGKSLHAICVSAADGKIVLDVEVFAPADPGPKHAKNSYASPTPLLDGDRVYVDFGTHGIAALSAADGKVLWKNEDLKIAHEVGPGSSPALFERLLILNRDGTDLQYVAALDKETGKLAWKTERSVPIKKDASTKKAFCTPLVIDVAGRAQAISVGADQTMGYDARTGAEIWHVVYDGFSNVPRPLFHDGLVYICTGFGNPELWAIRPDGEGDVTQSRVAWRFTKQCPNNPSPVIVGDDLFMVSDRGIATCLDAETGRMVWRERLEGAFSASLISAEGRIYAISEEGVCYILQASREFRQLARNEITGRVLASPAVSGKALFIRTHESLYRIEQ